MGKSYNISELYGAYSEKQRAKLSELYELIVASSEETLSQSLKWNQLSFTSVNGTPVRIDRFSETEVALFVHCQTTLIEQ